MVITHDDLNRREVANDEELESIFEAWIIPQHAVSRHAALTRIGNDGFIYNVSARSWIINIDEFAGCTANEVFEPMAYDRILVCNAAILLLRDIQSNDALKTLNAAIDELDAYNTLVQTWRR